MDTVDQRVSNNFQNYGAPSLLNEPTMFLLRQINETVNK